MALTIDDGSFEVGNTFTTAIATDDYAELRAVSSWIDSTDDDAKDAAMIRAFDYLKVISWSSTAFTSGVPARIVEAQMVAAIKELAKPGVMQPTEESNLKKQIIGGAIEKEYFEAGRFSGTIHNDILNLIKPYLLSTESTTSGTTRYLVRR